MTFLWYRWPSDPGVIVLICAGVVCAWATCRGRRIDDRASDRLQIPLPETLLSALSIQYTGSRPLHCWPVAGGQGLPCCRRWQRAAAGGRRVTSRSWAEPSDAAGFVRRRMTGDQWWSTPGAGCRSLKSDLYQNLLPFVINYRTCQVCQIQQARCRPKVPDCNDYQFRVRTPPGTGESGNVPRSLNVTSMRENQKEDDKT